MNQKTNKMKWNKYFKSVLLIFSVMLTSIAIAQDAPAAVDNTSKSGSIINDVNFILTIIAGCLAVVIIMLANNIFNFINF